MDFYGKVRRKEIVLATIEGRGNDIDAGRGVATVLCTVCWVGSK